MLFETKAVFLMLGFAWIGVLQKFPLADAKGAFPGYLWGGPITPWIGLISERENSSHLRTLTRSSVPSLCSPSWMDLALFKDTLCDSSSSSFHHASLPRIRENQEKTWGEKDQMKKKES